ncbi:hypothetical protein ZWY2020_042110 [Hordeum vulgare]|nr:hypothetical protein ZWY2020_042110 [Hordeum vulgare]
MKYVPGAASRRPERSSYIIISTTEMESDASHLRRTALLAIARDRRININSALVDKAIEKECGLAIHVFQIAPAFPEDFLLRFNEPFQQDTALERGFLTIRGVTFDLRPWEPATEGRVRDWWFYCRLAIVGLDFHTWRLDVVRKLLRGSCHVDRLERQTERLHNAAAMYVSDAMQRYLKVRPCASTRSPSWGWLGKGVRESRHRAPSRSPSDERRWGNSLSPPLGSRRADSENSFTAVPAGTLRMRGPRTSTRVGSGTGQPAPMMAAPLGREGNAEGLMAEMVAAALAACVVQRPRRSQSAAQCRLESQLHANPALEEAMLQVSEDALGGNQFGGSNIPGLLGDGFHNQGLVQHGQVDSWNMGIPAIGIHQDQAGSQVDWGRRVHELISTLVPRSIWAPPTPPLGLSQVDPQEARARSALLEANLSGKGLLSAVTNSVLGLHLDEQQQFLSQLFAAMPLSLLSAPPSSAAKVSIATTIKKKVMAPFSRRTAANAALRPSMTSTRRTQARVCKALGLFSTEDQFTDATLQD